MCLIIDTNVAHKVLLKSDDADFKDVHAWLFTAKKPYARLVYGGRLATEYLRSANLRRIIAALGRAGRATRLNDELVDAEEQSVTETRLCQSDDEHIIAVARVGRVRLLCSHDGNLHADFTNKALLDTPRGKVYQTRSHKKLLRTFCG